MERLPFYRRIGHLGPDFGHRGGEGDTRVQCGSGDTFAIQWVDTFAQPTSKGISPFLLICQMEKSSHLYRTPFS